MGELIARLFFALTGGRPMFDEGYAFTFNGEVVHYYNDRLGRSWMATTSRVTVFRVRQAATLVQDMKVWAWRRR